MEKVEAVPEQKFGWCDGCWFAGEIDDQACEHVEIYGGDCSEDRIIFIKKEVTND